MKRNFTLEYWIDDEWYMGRMKEVPGVFSQGETLEELEENIKDAFEMMAREYIRDSANSAAQIKEIFLEKELHKGIINIRIDLKEFEEKHKMSSEEFYRQFSDGLLGDDEEFMIWAGIFEMLRENEAKLGELK